MDTQSIRHFINGAFVASASGKCFENRSPTDNRVIGQVCEGGREEVDAAVAAAKAALAGPWGQMPMAERAALLHRVADRINERFEEFLEAECLDTGKPKSLASHIDIPRGAANFKVFADAIKNVPTESFRLDTPDNLGAVNIGHRSPKGVIAVISPWNLPLLLMTWKVGPALACGNTVIVKPSEETPLTTTLLGEVMNECGVPAGVYNVVHGFGPDSAGAFLTEHPDVDAITFTGETRTGEIIAAAAAKGLRDVSLECGGKNAAIVFDDADLDKAIEGTMRSAFVNCGQVCLGTERVYVQSDIYDAFKVRLVEAAKALRIGPPGDPDANMGPLISKEHQEKVLSYYQLAIDEGATLLTGGGVPPMPDELSDGCWVEPTIWEGLDDSARVIRKKFSVRAVTYGPLTRKKKSSRWQTTTPTVWQPRYGLKIAVAPFVSQNRSRWALPGLTAGS